MSFRERWTAARDRQRLEWEAQNAERRRVFKRMELERLGVPAGELDAILTADALDAMVTAERARQAQLYEVFERATVAKFRALGVQVLAGDDVVYGIGNHDPAENRNDSRVLGPLAGAEAMVTDTTSAFSAAKALVMPLVTAPLARKETADAVVIFANRTTHTAALDGSQAVRDARRQAVEFNVLAGASSLPTTQTGSDPAARLQKLQELRDAGLLSRQEYEAKRAEVIESI